jgi:hypothetical protein
VASGEPVSIEQACDQVLGGDPHQHADGFDDLTAVLLALSTVAARQTQLGMNTAGPMEHEDAETVWLLPYLCMRGHRGESGLDQGSTVS